ncbi:cysteine and histidine-rich protein 1-like [Actinia tenebrosa]|uniref:Cysteine and histidine-rich protein 1-like n=1 Tax=Actinia tenebrosa TaxID=6105 RepID=A0A6P8IYY7_ACTTE|nr:cysteine and histidine-rich protein 1-like [Actinia tenebrosa]
MSNTENQGIVQVEDTTDKENIEPPAKKPKTETKKLEDLETRLYDILSCNVCLSLPSKEIYQCPHGHLMCCSCLTHLLADARLKDEQATCPNCRTEISRSNCSRNLAVEKAVSELPTKCQYCSQEFLRVIVRLHEKEECTERLVECKYKRLGCQWQGPFHELSGHEGECLHPNKTGIELMTALDTIDETNAKRVKTLETIVGLLSFEKIAINDLQLRSYRTDDFIPQLYYETSRFNALGQQWVVKVKVDGSEKILKRNLLFQLIQKTKGQVKIKFMMIRSPFGDLSVNPTLHYHEFTADLLESEFYELAFVDNLEANKMLASKIINLRLMMFQLSN